MDRILLREFTGGWEPQENRQYSADRGVLMLESHML